MNTATERPVQHLSTFAAAGLIGLSMSVATGAVAQTSYTASHGPYILPTDRATGRPVPDDARAIPVPSVMNGGGFGLSGNSYFEDSPTEGPLNGRRRPHEFVLAPARVAPPAYGR
ncbi:hypothetical protein ASF26_08200 [Methylobacterium sp. Leaf93]|nr:hypothetical protein ASF26_08200 [Methylobacterium sp. Leaf93]